MAEEELVELVETGAANPEPETAYGALVSWSLDQQVLHPDRPTYVAVVEALKADGFVMCIDVWAVDYLTNDTRVLPDGVRPERYEVVASFINHVAHTRMRVRVQVPAEDPTIASLFDVYPGAEAMEREAFDMFGITFENHPDMCRILMPDDWEGHPLRKDYAIGSIPVQFKASPAERS